MLPAATDRTDTEVLSIVTSNVDTHSVLPKVNADDVADLHMRFMDYTNTCWLLLSRALSACCLVMEVKDIALRVTGRQ